MTFRILCPLLVLAVSVGGCGRPAAPTGAIRVVIESSPSHPDPRMGTDQASERLHHLAFRGLVRRTAIGDVEPDLAVDWTWSEDGTSVSFRLDPEARFVDGRELTATDVEWTYSSLLDPVLASPRRGSFLLLAEEQPVEAMSRNQVVFRCRPAMPCRNLLLSLNLGIVPAGVTPTDTQSDPIGAGPMRVVRIVPDERVELESAFEPSAPPVHLVVIPDATSRALALLEGSVDLAINNLSPDLVERFRTNPEFEVREVSGTNYSYLGFNCADPVLSDERVRRAVALAVDRTAILDGLQRGLGDLTETILPRGHRDRADGLPVLDPDPEAARRLLAEAGFGPTRPLDLVYRTSTDEMAILQATAVQSMLAEVDVRVTIRSTDFSTFYTDVKRGAMQLYSLTWTGVVDPDILRMVFHSEMLPPDGWNRGRYGNPDVDRLVDRAARLGPGEERRQLYGQVQRIVRDELPYLSLWHRRNVAVFRRGLGGVDLDSLGDFRFLVDVRRAQD